MTSRKGIVDTQHESSTKSRGKSCAVWLVFVDAHEISLMNLWTNRSGNWWFPYFEEDTGYLGSRCGFFSPSPLQFVRLCSKRTRSTRRKINTLQSRISLKLLLLEQRVGDTLIIFHLSLPWKSYNEIFISYIIDLLFIIWTIRLYPKKTGSTTDNISIKWIFSLIEQVPLLIDLIWCSLK